MLEESVDEWKKSLTQYANSKKELEWKKNQPVTYITEKMKKNIEAKYNPILQKYTDPNTEKLVQAKEQEDFIRTLAQNKVFVNEM